jgi:hypothetical protein
MKFMKKTFFSFKHFVTLALGLTMSVGAFAGGVLGSDGVNGAVSLSVDKTSLSVNDVVVLTATVSGMTDDTGVGKSKGDCKYTITIPTGVTQQKAPETSLTNDLTDKGESGNGTYNHGSYTATTVGTYKFGLTVETGSAGNDGVAVSFCPSAPTNLKASNITPTTMDLSWDAGAQAVTYIVSVNGVEYPEQKETSLSLKNLPSATKQQISIVSKNGDLKSVSSLTGSFSTLAQPQFTMSSVETLNVKLGNNQQQTISVSAANLASDVSLALSTNGGYSIQDNVSIISKETSTLDLILNFVADKIGNFVGTLKATTQYLADVVIDFSATVSPEVVALNEVAEENVYSSGCTLTWNAIAGATSYVINVYDANGQAVDGNENVEVDGSATSYEVENLLPEANYTITICAKGEGGFVSETSEPISIRTKKGPVITYVPLSKFSQSVNEKVVKTLYLEGANLTQDISVSISGEGFSIEEQSLSQTSSSVKVAFFPTSLGTYEGQITVSSPEFANKVIPLSGEACPEATIALEATDLAISSFVANWTAVDNADRYLLTLKRGSEVIFENREVVSTNYKVTGCSIGEEYTYSVKVVKNDVSSNKSNDIVVVMPKALVVNESVKDKSIYLNWNNVASSAIYILELYNNSLDLIATEQTSSYSYEFEGLSANTAYTYNVIAKIGEEQIELGQKSVRTKSSTYGEQVGNSDFELWDNESNKSAEPQNWNGFMTAGGQYAGTAAAQCMNSTTDVRPGAVAGSKGVYLYSYKAAGIAEANGNLTVGKINAGAMSAKDQANHNATIPNNEAFSETMTSRPDSITAWVKLMTNDVNARISAIIHDDFSFEDPSREEDMKHVVGEAKLNYARVNDKSGNATWQRLSVPFDYATYASLKLDPKYILITFTTNATPGGAAAQVYVDDMALIYKPTLSIADLTKKQYVGGDVISLDYSIEGSMSVYNINAEANVVRLELSDANGSFANPTILTSMKTNYGGTLVGTLPTTLEDGDNYHLRVVTTNYPMTKEYATSISIRNTPKAPVAIDATNVSAVSFTANWKDVEGATSYEVTVLDNKREVVATVVTTETSATFKGLKSETNYSYTVKVNSSYVTSDSSNEITLMTAGGGTITYDGTVNFSAKNTTSTVSIQGIGLVEGEKIYITLNDGSGLFSVDTSTLPIEGGEIKVTFNPSVVGVHSATVVLKSKLVNPSVVIPLTGVVYPSETTTTEASEVGLYSFTANWSAVEGADSYDLIIKENGTQILNPKGLTSTSYVVENLKPNTTYTYSVVVNQNGVSSESSSEQTVTTLALPVIDNLVIGDLGTAFFGGEAISKTFTLSGSNLTEQISAVVSDTENFSVAVEGNQLTVSYKPVAVKDYSAKLTLSHANATPVEIAISGKTALSAPVVGVATDITNKSATLSWNDVPGAMSYMVFVTRVDDNAPVGNPISAESTTCSLSVARANYNKKLSYYVQAIAGDVRSEESDLSQFQLFSAAKLSDATNITETGFTANFSASAVAGVAYKVVVLNENGVEVFSQTTTETSIDVTGLTTNATYTYTVTTICEGNEQISAVSSIQLISASTILEATNITETGFTANFSASAVAGVEYKVVVLDENGVEVFSQTTTETSIEVTNLKPETTYTYTIATIVGGNEQVSASATITTDVAPIEPDPSTSVENAEVENLVVYPNPTVDVINVKGVNVRQAVVYSNVGQQLMNVQSAQSIDVSTLPAGVYQLIIVSEEGTSRSVSFMKK